MLVLEVVVSVVTVVVVATGLSVLGIVRDPQIGPLEAEEPTRDVV